MHAAHENSPAAGRRAGRAKTTQWSRRSWPSEKRRAGTLEVKVLDPAWQALWEALLSCHVKRSETSSYFNADFAAKATENFVTLFDTGLVEVAGFFASL